MQESETAGLMGSSSAQRLFLSLSGESMHGPVVNVLLPCCSEVSIISPRCFIYDLNSTVLCCVFLRGYSTSSLITNK